MKRTSVSDPVRLLLLVVMVVLLGGCSAHVRQDPRLAAEEPPQPLAVQGGDVFELEDEFEPTSAETLIDPLSGYNRLMTQVNDRVYFWLLKPVARGYRAVVPEGARLAVGRFFRNLQMPVRFVNNLLQLKPKQAGTELARFSINTTVGVLGLGDPAAERFDLQPYPEDFGQTMGHYGISSGFHIVLPLLGPSNLRDALALVPDYYLEPLNAVEDFELRIAARVYERVNHTSLHIGEYESVKKDAVDLYPFLRDAYEQRRAKQIEE